MLRTFSQRSHFPEILASIFVSVYEECIGRQSVERNGSTHMQMFDVMYNNVPAAATETG
jgi:hypothetical protein